MKGKVVQWKEDKGFGFIQPEDGSERLFFHISSVKTDARRPEVGDSVLYGSMRDAQQRLKAKSVIIEGVSKASSSLTTRQRSFKIEPPKKNIIDYLSIMVIVGSLAALGVELYRSNPIEHSWPYGIPAVIAFFILNRQKKPKDTSFHCVRCRKVAEHDSRTIQAWNNGFVKLYCRACHQLWLQDKPHQESSFRQSKGGGCLGVLALILVMPVLSGIGLYQWLA